MGKVRVRCKRVLPRNDTMWVPAHGGILGFFLGKGPCRTVEENVSEGRERERERVNVEIVSLVDWLLALSS